MNIVKELHNTARKNYNNQLRDAEQVLESVKANLEIEDKKDSEMLRYFGTKLVVSQQKTRIKDVSRFIEGEFVTLADIKSVCLKYHLRFLNASYYKKEVPLTALNDMRKFKEDYKIEDYDMMKNLMVIAPASHFTLGPRPAKDPVLLYKQNGVFKIVSTWGNDFTFLRRLVGMFAFTAPITVFILAMVLFNLTLYLFDADGADYIFNLIVVAGVLPMCSLIGFSKDYWDEPYK